VVESAAATFPAARQLMQEPCIETVPGADRIHDLDSCGRTDKTITAALCQRSIRPYLHHEQRYHGSQLGDGIFNILCSCNFLRFACIR
jgi:hypothetical protein